jgi:enediyne biosynthesis protein E4
VRDFDNDGWPDVFYNALTDQVWGLFRNLRGKSFRYFTGPTGLVPLSTPYSGWSAGFIDFNNDGWKDIFSANGDVDSLRPNAEQHDTIFQSVEGKRFVDVSAQMGAHFQRNGYQRGAAFADLNNDGFLDVVVTSLNRRPAILLNAATGARHWLTVRLEGRKANRDSIGARITVITPTGRMLRDWVSPSVGFLSSSDRRVHFGLGGEAKVASIEIQWPGGNSLTMKDVAADRILTIREPL